VDVNVHPAKREVKFHREFEIRKFVAQAVQETLLAFHVEPEKPKQNLTTKTQSAPSEAKAETKLAPELFTPSLPAFPQKAKPVLTVEFPKQVFPTAVQSEIRNPKSEIPHSAPSAKSADSFPPSSVPLLNVPLRLVGVIGRLYVVLESDRGLVLLDQHAAHERILYEQMLNRLEQNGSAPSQKLLLPETIELPARDANFLREQLAALTRLGVGLSEFGERTFLLDALPPFVKATDSRRFVLDLVDELKAAGREVNLARLGEHTIAKTVCRHAVKANDPLAGAELENLVEDLRRCAMPYTCPHGRPTLIEMNYRELEKKFGRTQ
jgi:DNA mismatch repair protein MutL